MKYAQVVLGLPVEGRFDYTVPRHYRTRVSVGSRVKVSFGNRKKTAYVIGVSNKSRIDAARLKPVLSVLDEYPLIEQKLIALAREISDYYCCSWGEALEVMLPEALRRGKIIKDASYAVHNDKKRSAQEASAKVKGIDAALIYDQSGKKRWDYYIDSIKDKRNKGQGVIFLAPDSNQARIAHELIVRGSGEKALLFLKKLTTSLNDWFRILHGEARIVVSTRSGVFAPVKNLGLIILDNEHSQNYKQEQAPHYHAREAAFMRCRIEHAGLIMGSSCPSLESMFLARLKKQASFIFLPSQDQTGQLKVMDAGRYAGGKKKQKIIIPEYLKDLISNALNEDKKALLFLNRKGFATSAFCRHCSTSLKCPRCQSNLVFYFSDNTLKCRYCRYSQKQEAICPNCNSAYIRYSGAGTQKIESELHRLFPQATIARVDSDAASPVENAQICVATSSIVGLPQSRFHVSGVLSVDNLLNRVDFRSAEKTFMLLSEIMNFTTDTLFVETRLPSHHCFRALGGKSPFLFYDEELVQRRQARFPPFTHFVFLRIRGGNEERVKEKAAEFLAALTAATPKGIEIMSLSPDTRYKLRGKYHWRILLKGASPVGITKFIKSSLKNHARSGIIMTVDVDPL